MTCSMDPNSTTDPAQKNSKIFTQFCFQFPSSFFLLKVFLENKPEANWVYYSVVSWEIISSCRAAINQSREFHGLYRPEHWSGEPFPPRGDLPNPEIKPRSPTLQADSFPSEPPGNPMILEWVAYPFSRGSSWPRNRIGVSCVAGGFFTSRAIREAPKWKH